MIKETCKPERLDVVPKEYLEEISSFLDAKKFGNITLVIQNGKVVGCDILEKRREM